MADPKAWYTSKLFWLGILTTVLGVVPILTELASQTSVTPAAVGTAVTGIVMVIVRIWFTDSPTTKPLGIGSKSTADQK